MKTDSRAEPAGFACSVERFWRAGSFSRAFARAFARAFCTFCTLPNIGCITLKNKGIDLLTRVRKNMKEVINCEFNQALLRKRSLVETVFDELKNLCQIEHTRHR